MKLNQSLFIDYKKYPERIIQFGEGNFLRAFADWIIDRLNKELEFNSGVLVVQPRDSDSVYKLNEQNGLYTLLINGINKDELVQENTIINSITRGISTYKEYDEFLKGAENPGMRIMISNTTEAGIVYEESDRLEDMPQSSFPGKLTAFLYHRYKTFNGDLSKGLLLLPCELIERNGDRLKEIILKLSKDWGLEEGFVDWINNANTFYNTLVDRIVPGYPKEKAQKIEKELGYEDSFLVECEYFYLWVIEGPEKIKDEFPTEKLGLNVLFVDDLTPYRTMKVRILNGTHTSMVPVSYLFGLDTVKESVDDSTIGKFINSLVFNEIIPTLDLPSEGLKDFANDVIDRFRNPFIKHYLMSISLNSMSKFKTRVLPSILEYIKRKNELPTKLLFSFAALIAFYKGERNGEKIHLLDNPEYLNMFTELWGSYDGTDEYIRKIVEAVLGLEDLWEIDLNSVNGIMDRVAGYLINIERNGIKEAIKEIL